MTIDFKHQVVAMSGTEARRTFYHDAQLDFSQGYRLLMGGVSQILNISPDEC